MVTMLSDIINQWDLRKNLSKKNDVVGEISIDDSALAFKAHLKKYNDDGNVNYNDQVKFDEQHFWILGIWWRFLVAVMMGMARIDYDKVGLLGLLSCHDFPWTRKPAVKFH